MTWPAHDAVAALTRRQKTTIHITPPDPRRLARRPAKPPAIPTQRPAPAGHPPPCRCHWCGTTTEGDNHG